MDVRKKVRVEKLSTFTGHRDAVYALEQAQEPHLFFSASADGLVASWNLLQPDQGELLARIPASVYALHYLREQNQLWIGQNFDGIHVIDLDSKQEIKSVKLTNAAIFDIKNQGQEIFIATGDGTVIVMDTITFTVQNHIKASDKSARSLAIHPLKKELAVGYSDHTIRIFDLYSLLLKQEIEAHQNSVFSLTYSPDYKYLLSGSRDAHLKVWDVNNDYQLSQSIVAHMYAINHIAFSQEGDYFLTCSMDKSIKVWDATTCKLLKVIDRARHAGHGTSVNKLLWTSHKGQVISASDDRTISVWQLNFE
ncbi:WD40 repeat domain-containing protein [Rhodocytophaga rosea]|uniref:WD40 repeat domain-containing protein n=1 Tax=Rhodocytophaga rosea TaxID=2704465 RepID=A0A6C0GPT8_9BACT|nr:WD40 repeat domain-containing protein [Rhodocytophaga rosea]QHT70085.1 WD40 repeat domain-containing protein [Rhodocytophaga rosea]